MFSLFSRRDFVSAVALAMLSAISLAAATQAYLFGWSTGHTLDRAELFVWLSTRELGSLPRAMKLKLARQFEQDFVSEGDWREEVGELDAARRARFLENYGELAQTWLLDKVDRYYELREPQRTEYVDSQIDSISRWPMLKQSGNPPFGGDPSRNLAQLQARFRQLKPDEQRRVQQFMGAVYMRWLARGFRQLIPLVPDET
ncbi:MAG TPA: hypothetical protein VMV10_19425 [Pirellulales bacterium]|nr:hypothetical protein [Pirellulales bacterium]